jgi:hypothetical protein
MRPITLALAVAAAFSWGGCESETASRSTTIEGAVAAWKAAGLPRVELDADEAPKLSGGDCRGGAMEGLELALCEYASPEAAREATEAGLKAVGAATGAALANGRLLLIVADRDGADPDGKRINTLTRAFLALESAPED